MNMSQILSWEIAKIANLLCDHKHDCKNIKDCLSCIYDKIEKMKKENKKDDN